MHAWYFGHDFTFAVICFYQWFYVVDWWLFKVLCIGCMVFMVIEIFSLYQCVKNERQEVFGRFNEIGHYQPGMKFLAVFTLLGTCFTFAPRGIGFFATVVDPLNNPMFFVVGALCVVCSIRAIYLAWKLPALPEATTQQSASLDAPKPDATAVATE